MPILSNIPFGSGHLENASITGKRGISSDVARSHWILRLNISIYGDFHKKNIKTLTPNEFFKSALVNMPFLRLFRYFLLKLANNRH